MQRVKSKAKNYLIKSVAFHVKVAQQIFMLKKVDIASTNVKIFNNFWRQQTCIVYSVHTTTSFSFQFLFISTAIVYKGYF